MRLKVRKAEINRLGQPMREETERVGEGKEGKGRGEGEKEIRKVKG